jgi:hypothetical protein
LGIKDQNKYLINYRKGGDQIKSLFKLGIILIGLIILGYAEVCNAQCAWVLWQKLEVYESGKFKAERSYNWMIVGAFSTENQCRGEEKAMCIKYAEGMKIKCIEDWGGHRIVTGRENDLAVSSYKCLPDTVDPRK